MARLFPCGYRAPASPRPGRLSRPVCATLLCRPGVALQSSNLDDVQDLLVDLVAAGAKEIESVLRLSRRCSRDGQAKQVSGAPPL
jgi:hypothetical protein